MDIEFSPVTTAQSLLKMSSELCGDSTLFCVTKQ